MKTAITLLTLSRIIIAPLLFILIVYFQFFGWAFILFLITAFTDYLDGFLARKYNYESVIGEILDPIADKIIIIFLLFALSIHLESFFVAGMGATMVARDIWVNGVREYNARFSQSDKTKVTFLAKIKTTIQMITISTYLFALFLGNSFLLFISDFLLFLSAGISLLTGFKYTVSSMQSHEEQGN
jgi:CDP-diacylglycerol--glycerol-3-phosphate 3-phosphatidyltransferase